MNIKLSYSFYFKHFLFYFLDIIHKIFLFGDRVDKMPSKNMTQPSLIITK